jgi:hypothetical protein
VSIRRWQRINHSQAPYPVEIALLWRLLAVFSLCLEFFACFPSHRSTDERTTIFGDLAQVRLAKLRRAVARAGDAKLLHPVTKRVGVNVYHFRCTLWTINHSPGLLKHSQDMVSVYLVEREASR